MPEGPAFSSEEYLRAANGPFAPYFRNLIPDVDSKDKLDLARMKDFWITERDRIGNYYGFTQDQFSDADKIVHDREKVADEWFQAPENREKVKKYLDELAEVEAVERDPKALDYQRENAQKDRRTVETQRKDLVKEIDPWTSILRDGIVKIGEAGLDEKAAGAGPKPAEPIQPPPKAQDQPATKSPDAKPGEGGSRRIAAYAPPMDQLQKLDRLTMYGLSAIGLCLMLGLFTPLAALGGAAMLLNFYLSMPPFPGLPESPKLEGHYRFVNKNLVEMFACLALASTPSGLWIGIDAFLFGWIGRGRRRREAEAALIAAEALVAERGRQVPQDRRKFKSR